VADKEKTPADGRVIAEGVAREEKRMDGRKAALDTRREMDRSGLQAELDAKEGARKALALEFYEDDLVAVPLSEVAFVEKRRHVVSGPGYETIDLAMPHPPPGTAPPALEFVGIEVVMVSSTWNHEHDEWDGSLWIAAGRAGAFLAAFRKYRGWLHELASAGTLLVGTREEVAG